MNPRSSQPDNSSWMAAFNSKTLTLGGEVGCLTLIIVIVSVFGGIWLDRLLGTKPLFTVGLVLLSAPLSLFLTFWIAKRAVKDLEVDFKAQKIDKEEGGDV